MSQSEPQQPVRCASRTITFPRLKGTPSVSGVAGALDHPLIEQAQPALARGEPVRIETPIRNTNRTVGATRSGQVARRYGNAGLPDDTIVIQAQGTGGQSFGAFLAHGVTLILAGEANDYVGKGLAGGRGVYPLPGLRRG